ncbi:MAG: Rieske 2Fe-2S domain-containing protein [Mariniphaga sp.]
MKRDDFLTTLGISAATVFFVPFLVSCSKSNSVVAPGSGGTVGGAIDFTLDLTSSSNAVLNSNGGSLLKTGVLVARTSSGAYVAVASACTHQGFTLIFDSTNNIMHCDNHGSNFGLTGAVVNGPATVALKSYNTQLTGTMLRVFG